MMPTWKMAVILMSRMDLIYEDQMNQTGVGEQENNQLGS